MIRPFIVQYDEQATFSSTCQTQLLFIYVNYNYENLNWLAFLVNGIGYIYNVQLYGLRTSFLFNTFTTGIIQIFHPYSLDFTHRLPPHICFA